MALGRSAHSCFRRLPNPVIFQVHAGQERRIAGKLDGSAKKTGLLCIVWEFGERSDGKHLSPLPVWANPDLERALGPVAFHFVEHRW